MKTIYLLILFASVAFINPAKAQYPIPSYNVTVNGQATFEENEQVILPPSGTDRTKQVIVQSTFVHLNAIAPIISVWFYSLDGENKYGPYTLDGKYIVFEIDDRPWGVLTVTTQAVLFDVWIE